LLSPSPSSSPDSVKSIKLLEAGLFLIKADLTFGSNNFPIADFPNSRSQSFFIAPTDDPFRMNEIQY